MVCHDPGMNGEESEQVARSLSSQDLYDAVSAAVLRCLPEAPSDLDGDRPAFDTLGFLTVAGEGVTVLLELVELPQEGKWVARVRTVYGRESPPTIIERDRAGFASRLAALADSVIGTNKGSVFLGQQRGDGRSNSFSLMVDQGRAVAPWYEQTAFRTTLHAFSAAEGRVISTDVVATRSMQPVPFGIYESALEVTTGAPWAIPRPLVPLYDEVLRSLRQIDLLKMPAHPAPLTQEVTSIELETLQPQQVGGPAPMTLNDSVDLCVFWPGQTFIVRTAQMFDKAPEEEAGGEYFSTRDSETAARVAIKAVRDTVGTLGVRLRTASGQELVLPPGLLSRDSRVPSARDVRVERPTPRLIRSPADAESAAADWLRWMGFRDATTTPVGKDEGRDVVGSGLVAQVKAEKVLTGRPVIQQTYGVAVAEDSGAAVFSLAGFTNEAIDWANRHGIALFAFDLQGEPEPSNELGEAWFDGLHRD